MEKPIPKQGSNRVLVVGAGIGGMTAALDLAEAGRDVVLIDHAPSIGGLMAKLDRTFPTNNCDMCTISPHLAESGRELHIEILPLTKLSGLSGEPGAFSASLVSQPRHIDLDLCTACGECFEAFPECVRFTPGLDPRAPTCMRYPQATPAAYSIDWDACQDTEALMKVCRTGAIKHQAEADKEVEIGAVVLAPGAELSEPAAAAFYGYGSYDNVVTGLEYERIMYASGPTGGELIRPSDGQQPKKVAWIQCVGSRSVQEADKPYCSSVCCMYALKEAIVTKERFQDDIETSIFYMDMRTCGKDYELYLNRAQNEYGVRLVRCRPHTVLQDEGTGDLVITYAKDETSGFESEAFDMVVLSTGFRIPPDLLDLSGRLNIELNKHGFAQTDPFNPQATSREGVFVCGLFESPKDIPETIIQASAAAGLAGACLPPPGKSETDEDELPPERDVENEPLRIGLFVCDCGENIGGVLDANVLAAYGGGLPGVAVSEMVGHGCSREAMGRIAESIESNQLNRLLIAGCSPRTHENKFQDLARQAGLNRHLVEIANIRDQVTWVHGDRPGDALAKAKDIVRMAASCAALRRALPDQTLPVNKDVLVVGGGVAGMSAALNLADEGFKVFLVERESKLGGLARQVRRTLEGQEVQPFLNDLIARTEAHEGIQVLTDTLVADHSGLPGLFTTGIQSGRTLAYRRLRHGATVLATGSTAHRPDRYLLGKNPTAVTQLDLDALLEDDPERVKSWQSVVMIQCVGSRDEENPNCSRVCCQAAVKNALRLLDLNPEMRIMVLNRDIRTYGFQEDYYSLARKRGVIFVRYQPETPPLVEEVDGALQVTFTDPILGMNMLVKPDCLALSTGFLADDENTEDLANIFRIPRTDDGYFLEDHVKLRPVDLPVRGFTVAGTAHAPKNIRESVAQGLAAAARVKATLAQDEINLGATVARVDGKRCAACLICVRACPYGIPFINADGYSEIDPAKCQGCGVCAAECPAKAIQLMRFEDDLILASVDGLLDGLFMQKAQ